jgi:endonuclease-3
MRARVRRIRQRLAEIYGVPELPPHGDPIAELVLTVLSQSTNDRNRDVAYLRLRERFARVAEPPDGGGAGPLVMSSLAEPPSGPAPPCARRRAGNLAVDWVDVRDAPVQAIEEAIRPGGISKVKSARIAQILAALPTDEVGAPTLDALPAMPVVEARALLTALPGVGRKTAACVLLFSFGMRDVPVESHVGRVCARLGLLPASGSADAIHDAMLALTPRGAELELHVNLLRHGRRTCHAQRPRCSACGLARMCPRRGVEHAV